MNTRFTIALVLPLMILGCKSEEASDSGQGASDSGQEASDSGQLVRLECSYRGRFTERGPWKLALDADGRAKLTIDPWWPNVTSIKNKFEGMERTFVVEQERIAAIEAAVDKYRFFELPAEVGVDITDAGRRVLSIRTTNGEKTVTIYTFSAVISLDDYSVRMESLNEDARRAIKLWKVVRDCFGDEEAADARPRDKWLLQQVYPGRLKEDEIKELKELSDKLGRSQEAKKNSSK